MEQTITFLLGIALGWTVCKIWMSYVFRAILNDLGVKESQILKTINGYEAEQKEQKKSVVNVSVELVGTRLYAYNRDTNTFICYGDSATELVEGMISKLPTGTQVLCSKEHGAAYIEPALEKMIKE